jgi:hypothetical protein
MGAVVSSRAEAAVAAQIFPKSFMKYLHFELQSHDGILANKKLLLEYTLGILSNSV